MRGTIAILAIAVLGFFGYQLAVNGKSPVDVFSGAPSNAEVAAAEAEAAELAAAAEAEAAEMAAAAELEAAAVAAAAEEEAMAIAAAAEAEAAELAAAAEAATAEAAAALEEAAAEATTAAEEVVAESVETVTDMADDVVESVEGAVTDLVDDVAALTGDAAVSTDMSAALTPEGFDFDTVAAMIENSDLDAQTKAVTRAGLIGAQRNPDLLEGTLARLRTTLGM
jgi:colicin import membrane protein